MSAMRACMVFSVLFSLCGLAFLGCGERVEESDANVLSPSEDFRFQGLPVVEEGGLIPPDEIPVVTIEKVREDAENVVWRLKADPVPSLGDLVVVVIRIRTPSPPMPDFQLVSILKNNIESVEMITPRSDLDWSLNVASFTNLVSLVTDEVAVRLLEEFANPLPEDIGLPVFPFKLNDGYVVPQGFKFSYYGVGAPDFLDIPAKEKAQ